MTPVKPDAENPGTDDAGGGAAVSASPLVEASTNTAPAEGQVEGAVSAAAGEASASPADSAAAPEVKPAAAAAKKAAPAGGKVKKGGAQ